MPLGPIGGPPLLDPLGAAKPAARGAKGEKRKMRLSEVLRAAGWPANVERTARAVVMAESGGNPNIDNGVCCVGLFQINRVHRGKFGSPSDPAKWDKWIKNPINNAKVGLAIWKGAGRKFSPDWEAFTNGSYRSKFGQDPVLEVDETGVAGLLSDAGGVAADVADKALGPLDEIFSALLSPSTWFRVGKGFMGGTLVILGTGAVVFIVANRATGGAVEKTARKGAQAAITKKVL